MGPSRISGENLPVVLLIMLHPNQELDPPENMETEVMPEALKEPYPDLVPVYPQLAVVVGGAVRFLPEQHSSSIKGVAAPGKHAWVGLQDLIERLSLDVDGSGKSFENPEQRLKRNCWARLADRTLPVSQVGVRRTGRRWLSVQPTSMGLKLQNGPLILLNAVGCGHGVFLILPHPYPPDLAHGFGPFFDLLLIRGGERKRLRLA
jgi:hypothetical protein